VEIRAENVRFCVIPCSRIRARALLTFPPGSICMRVTHHATAIHVCALIANAYRSVSSIGLELLARSLARSSGHNNNYRTGSLALRRARFMLELGAACIEKGDEINSVGERERESERERGRERIGQREDGREREL